jgi:ribosomal protein S18 acetylase RimI-like enzyme
LRCYTNPVNSSPDPSLVIEVVLDPDPELVVAIERLLPQLSTATPPSLDPLRAIARADGIDLFIARLDGTVVGTLTLVGVQLLTGVRMIIEDVVVDDAARGHGVGEALVRAALERARSLGARSVDLTSRPSREAANRLYERTGFVRRETNVYRYDLEG